MSTFFSGCLLFLTQNTYFANQSTLMKESTRHPLDQLRDIHRLMERTSRFIGLSGLSGVGAGCFALAGAVLAQWYLLAGGLASYGHSLYHWPATVHPWGWSPEVFFTLDACFILAGALSSGIYFTTRRAQRKGQAIWDALTQRLLLNLAIPLLAGGIFCLALFYHGIPGLVAPTTLIFYGLALINGSKYTLNELYYLGLCELVLGSVGLFFIGSGLLLWTLGFGVLHIGYGVFMYRKYERNPSSP